MNTHPDHDAESSSRLSEMFSNLQNRADESLRRGDTQLTAGKPGEIPITEERIGNVFIKQLPEDKDCLRVSIGGPDFAGQFSYLVFRGNPDSIETQCRRALEAIVEFNDRRRMKR